MKSRYRLTNPTSDNEYFIQKMTEMQTPNLLCSSQKYVSWIYFTAIITDCQVLPETDPLTSTPSTQT